MTQHKTTGDILILIHNPRESLRTYKLNSCIPLEEINYYGEFKLTFGKYALLFQYNWLYPAIYGI